VEAAIAAPERILPVIEANDQEPVRLEGGWLLFGRAVFLVLTVISIYFTVSNVAGSFDIYTDQVAGFPAPETLHEGTRQLGLTEDAVEYFSFGVTLVGVSLAYGLATVLFFKRSDELAPLLVAVFLVAGNGAVFPPDLAEMWDTKPVEAVFGSIVSGAWISSFYWLFYVFPDGRIRPRWLIVPPTLFIIELLLVFFLQPNKQTIASDSDIVVLPMLLLFCLYAQFYKWRHVSAGVTRQQMKWAALGLAVAITSFVLLNLSAGLKKWDDPNADPALVTAYAIFFFNAIQITTGSILTLAFAAAIFRYRLFDVDVFISRALVYMTLTLLLVAIYVLVVIGLGDGLNATTGISAPVAAIVAVLAFEPLRRRLQGLVNRLMFGRRDDPYSVLAGLSLKLDEALTPTRVPEAITSTVTATLRLPWAAVSLEDGSLLAESGERGAVEQRFSITNAGSVIGSLAVSPRSGERAVGSRDREIVEDLCRQSGPALAALQLTEDLQRSRERLVTAREEERRRLRRDLHDGIGPRLAGLALRVETARDLAEDSPDLRGNLDDLAERLQDTVADIRRLVYGLRPPALDDLGLVAALRQSIEHYDPTGERMTFDAGDLPHLSAAVEVATYRIVQEALTNVVKHAPGAECRVSLRHDRERDELLISVIDRGPGAPAGSQPGVGLNSMRERCEELGGSFSFTSGNPGTEVIASLPLLPSDEQP
jgi:signal transduction histidine kinase